MKQIIVVLVLSLAACAGKDGAVGPQGPQGTPGATGPAGANGQDGTDGRDASMTPYTPVGLVNPCGDAEGIEDEILVALANGQLLVSYSDHKNGNNTRFVILTPGDYVTTDGDNCYFTIAADGTLTNERH